MEDIIISVDSKYRDIYKYPNESKFTLNLDKIYKNVVSVNLDSIELTSNINIISIEKQNLLLTCFKSLGDNQEQNNYKQTNKVLKCDNFFNKVKINNMLIPKYREWVKIFNFV